nr:hypothetical protein [Clostridia bacterium]
MRNRVILIILTFIFSITFIYSSLFTYFRIDQILTPPFGLSNNYVNLWIIYEPDPEIALDHERVKNIKDKMYEIVKDKEIVMIYEHIDTPGLGLYDPVNFYGTELLKEGVMFAAGKNCDIVVRENSYYYDYAVRRTAQNYIENIFGAERLTIKGVYDSKHPLYRRDHDYIYNYFSEYSSLVGDYYLDSESPDILNQVVSDIQRMLQEYGYICEITSKGMGDVKFSKIISSLFSYLPYLAVLIGSIFLCINIFLFYYLILSNQKKVVEIHSIFGATKFKIFLKYSKETLGYLALSSLLCVIVYYLGFTDIIASDVPIKAFIPIVFANIVIGYAIWTLAFLIGRIYKNPGW